MRSRSWSLWLGGWGESHNWLRPVSSWNCCRPVCDMSMCRVCLWCCKWIPSGFPMNSQWIPSGFPMASFSPRFLSFGAFASPCQDTRFVTCLRCGTGETPLYAANPSWKWALKCVRIIEIAFDGNRCMEKNNTNHQIWKLPHFCTAARSGTLRRPPVRWDVWRHGVTKGSCLLWIGSGMEGVWERVLQLGKMVTDGWLCSNLKTPLESRGERERWFLKFLICSSLRRHNEGLKRKLLCPGYPYLSL